MALSALWVLAFLAPLAGAVTLTLTRGSSARRRAWAVRVADLTLLPALALTLVPGGAPGREVSWLLLGTTVALDPIGRSLLLVAVLLYGAALRATARDAGPRSAELGAFLLVSFVGNMGVYAAADAVTFYLSFALMSFAAFGLVLHYRDESARRAGRVYLVLTVLSESAILVALLLVVAAGGTAVAEAPAAVAASEHTSLVVGLLLVGFGVKAGLVPLHVWLPLAHPAAPPAASAVLSGAMVKAGLVGWLRFLPLGEVEQRGWGVLLVVLALGGAFAAVPVGSLQRDPKVALAYSTVSQMGFIGAVVGVALLAPELAPACIVAGVVYAVHHGLAKGALFLGVPVWRHFGGSHRRLVLVGLTAAGLAVAGAPLSSGSVAKYAAKNAVEGTTVAGVDLVLLLPLVATGSTLLLLRFGYLLVQGDQEPSRVRRDPELPAWVALVLLSVSVPWLVTAWWLPLDTVPGLDPVTVWDASWPIVLGVVVGAVHWRLAQGSTLPDWAAHPDGRLVPPGDLVVPAERAARRLGGGAATAAEAAVRTTGRLAALAGLLRTPLRRGGAVLDRAEGLLTGWRGGGLVLLALLLATGFLPGWWA
jgi:formate hydrogenlyase subunit 3/multisubunit Na+/H+ antiporter MnhD subunit